MSLSGDATHTKTGMDRRRPGRGCSWCGACSLSCLRWRKRKSEREKKERYGTDRQRGTERQRERESRDRNGERETGTLTHINKRRGREAKKDKRILLEGDQKTGGTERFSHLYQVYILVVRVRVDRSPMKRSCRYECNCPVRSHGMGEAASAVVLVCADLETFWSVASIGTRIFLVRIYSHFLLVFSRVGGSSTYFP